MTMYEVANRASEMVRDDEQGGFPPQQQQPPGLTSEMTPVPDHGEDSYRGSGKLTGLKALITGGDSGIGRAVAIAYAREGADVAVSYLPDEEPDADAVVSLVESEGRKAVKLPGDLTEREVCEQVVNDAVKGLGGLDIVVNNAGFQWARGSGITDLEPEHVERVMRTNLFAVLWVTKAAVPHLGKGSSIINTSSIQAYDPSSKLVDYASTKAALNNMTVNLAGELGPRGIRVNAVAPGPIWTPLQPSTQESDALEKFGAYTPLGRAGQPAELAGAYVFLASPADASYVSGTVLGVTGGSPVF
jgi:NAD(P)-dependent dehydrogenase (short-subunit alcohol dehydrogenase family)